MADTRVRTLKEPAPVALGTLKLWFTPTEGIEYGNVNTYDVEQIRTAISKNKYPVAIPNGKNTSWLMDPTRRPLLIDFETNQSDE